MLCLSSSSHWDQRFIWLLLLILTSSGSSIKSSDSILLSSIRSEGKVTLYSNADNGAMTTATRVEVADDSSINFNSITDIPNPPRNVTVTVELSNQNGESMTVMPSDRPSSKDVIANKRLKLVIRWMHANEGKPPEGYNVEVRALTAVSDTPGDDPSSHSISCIEHFTDFFHHVEYSESTRLEIGNGAAKGEDQLVQFGCTYVVSVQSSPVSHPPNNQIVKITVPDCVEGICKCQNRPLLPRPESVNSELIPTAGQRDGFRSYRITWSYNHPDSSSKGAGNDSSLMVDMPEVSAMVLRVERAESVMGVGSVYRKIREYQHRMNQQPFQQVIPQVESHSSYRIRIAAHDVHHCEGQVAEIYLNRPESYSPASSDTKFHKDTMVSATVLGAVFLAVTALVIALSWRRFLRRVHLMTAAGSSNHHHAVTPARYSSRSPQVFLRDGRRPTMLFTSGNGSSTSGTCQNLIYNVFQQDKEAEECHHHLVSGNCNKLIDDYEIDPSQIKLGVEIGKGAFGRVHLATAENLSGLSGPTLVAVKQMKKRVGVDERDDFLAEIAMMKRVGRHENIVVMLACITTTQPYSMILEYVPYGDLLQYLRTLRNVYYKFKGLVVMDDVNNKSSQQQQAESSSITQGSVSILGAAGSSSAIQLLPNTSSSNPGGSKKHSPAASVSDSSNKSYHLNSIFSTVSSQSNSSSHSSTSYVIPNYYRGFLKACPTSRSIDTEELHDFARQIARGMEHLENKGITHRDLAARNLLVSEGRVLKISDFGLSRHGVYVNTRTRMLPLRWLALESMTDNLYSSQSDVWAFGVVLWEICTLGGFPYANVSDAQLMTYLMSGKRLSRPENVSEKFYQMMLKCWSGSPDDRPTFQQLRASLEEFEAQHETYVDFNCSGDTAAHTLPPTEEEAGAS